MRYKLFFILMFALCFDSLNASAQIKTSMPADTSPVEGKVISGGVLNYKALGLVKPLYPAAALAVRASGAVIVQALIDEEGNVVSASAVSGHPLLRQVCEQAARATKFKPTLLEEQPVKVRGVIVYNFVATMSFVQIGYELAFAEHSTSLPENFPAGDISGTFPNDWKEEKADVWKLNSYFSVKNTKEQPAQPEQSLRDANKENFQGKEQKPPREGIATKIDSIGTAGTSSVDAPDNVTTLNPSEVIKKLNSNIENRLALDKKFFWYFKFGQAAGKIIAEVENDANRLNLNELNKLAADIPSSVPEAVAAKAREISAISRQDTIDADKKKQLVLLIKKLRDLQTHK